MTASALAGDLHLPLFVIQLDGLITKFMGETAAKLRLVFDALSETRGVYLFDEVDALGGSGRGATTSARSGASSTPSCSSWNRTNRAACW